MVAGAGSGFKGKGVTDDPAGVTYWKVANGIRLTGKPGFGNSLSKEQMWQVSLLLANSDKLPAAVLAAWREPLPALGVRASVGSKVLVDLDGFEPSTSSMPWKRAPNCATGPQTKLKPS